MDAKNIFPGKDDEVVMRTVAQFLEVFLREADLENNKIVDGLKHGNTAAQTMGLTREDIEVLYTLGFNAINMGDLQKAQDIFYQLIAIDPLDARHYYCMGIIQQMRGKHKIAADLFISFLALDATNPDGYLRYGETQLALGDRKIAREAFICAEAEASKGNGDAATLAEARSKLAMMKAEALQ